MPLSLLPDLLPWWAGVAALAALLYTAIVDARTGLVPPMPLLFGGLVAVAGWLIVMPAMAPAAVLWAFAAYTVIWSLNILWRWRYKHDALGMGDASWTAFATLAYGWQLAVAAWGLGAILALVYLALIRACGKPARHVYFAPFLCAALLLANALRPLVL